MGANKNNVLLLFAPIKNFSLEIVAALINASSKNGNSENVI